MMFASVSDFIALPFQILMSLSTIAAFVAAFLYVRRKAKKHLAEKQADFDYKYPPKTEVQIKFGPDAFECIEDGEIFVFKNGRKIAKKKEDGTFVFLR